MKDIRINDVQEFGDWIVGWIFSYMVKYSRIVSAWQPSRNHQ